MFCTDIPSPIGLIFSSSTPTLLYYSHLPVIFTAILIGLLVFSKNKSLESKLLLSLVSVFSLWNLIDLINWTNVDSRIIMVSWSFMNFIFVLVPALALYFSYVFLERKEPRTWIYFFGVLPLFPFLLLLPTNLNLTGFDLTICEANEGSLTVYFHTFQIVYFAWLFFFLLYECRKNWTSKRKQVLLLSLGIGFFIASFYAGNIVSEFLETWEYEQYGLFGMLVFMTLLVVMIVKYEAFNIKILAAQALMGAFVILIGTEYFFVSTTSGLVLTTVTLLIAIIFAYFLIRSVQQEVQRKEELQEISDRLAVANAELRRLDNAKSEFISIASHQLRTPLTAIKGFVSLLLEGAYGQLEPSVADTLNKVYLANNRLMNLVENLLNISRIEAGRIQYQRMPVQITDLVTELRDIFVLAAHAKGLKFGITLPKEPLPLLSLDGAKIREAISNVIDNSIKYTETGEISVLVEKQADAVAIIVTDTGVGIDADDIPHIFKKFERGKHAAQINVSSTGLGLYVGKSFVEAHGGTIMAESAGRGQGTRFTIRLPIGRLEK
ncbi:MAG: HAMP domain-containing histidine kinase [Candidatus Moraniibacteriota bacterium]|nr:MAG: HAMP domain-containing histidine kinase [Candidatus Moranbacteria bacterium]